MGETTASISWLAVALGLLHLAGLAVAMRALMFGRTAQGTVAWMVALVLLPYIALPLYAVFGHGKFHGYVRARRTRNGRLNDLMRTVRPLRDSERALDPDTAPRELLALERLAELPFTRGNKAQLLIDGEQTFQSIFAGIAASRRYVLIQFYTIHCDGVGTHLKKALIERAREGVAVFVLYDEIGCEDMPSSYVEELRRGGVTVSAFNESKSWFARHSRINYRNHRKIVVVDGHTAWVGGLNVGDEYLGRHPTLSPWRDTHVRVTGPSVQGCQLSFMEDWHWATGEMLTLDWRAYHADGDGMPVLVLPTGPADTLETCGLAFGQMIAAARQRIWIANPYFVPDSHIVAALQLAAFRGVDVRVLIPGKPDHRMTWLASLSFLPDMTRAGVKVYLYEAGVLHQKTCVFDDRLATVGTANFDNRSFRLNFEITLVFLDARFNQEVADMLLRDFQESREVGADALASRSLAFRVAVQGARLLAPVL
ncbi:cardiolipin synthase [Vineibacter terrae]|uniref:cardiolipin synthase n=1 Tax=Vineibacter terrae TaxID=2586908 RepID=UPI002E37AA3A|nr:cardiolipin synthase [Vineibacter terrae]HEX2890730.1 cardiolipin synthase [Vineibacter terrae]